MGSYFVTGTGTEVGKTYVTAGIVRGAAELGRRFAAVKPLVSGYDAGAAAGSDPAVLLAAMGKRVTPRAIAAISPFRFLAPLSPDMAAAREGRRVDFEALVAVSQAAIEAAPVLIEGVGGVAVPLEGRLLVADWIAAVGVPAILVAGTYLGTLSHTITAAETLAARGIAVAAIVLSESVAAPVPAAEVAGVLRRLLPHEVHVIPRDLNDRSFRKLAGVL
jgi:dethiobiotin synthetase